MIAIFTKDMTFEALKKSVENESYRFFEMRRYLNEKGKVLEETYSIISAECEFSETKEELIENINQTINAGKIKNDDVIKKLNAFKKNILGELVARA